MMKSVFIIPLFLLLASCLSEKPDLEFIRVDGGKFDMGDSLGQPSEYPVHPVYLDGFLLSQTEVTNEAFVSFLNEKNVNSKGILNGLNIFDNQNNDFLFVFGRFFVKPFKSEKPVTSVTWFGANAFCKWIGGRLPTEAEWEYAAVGGTKSRGYKYCGSNNADSCCWYEGNAGKEMKNVGLKKPNELGFYDMCGNAYEWCFDWFENKHYQKSASVNPRGPGKQKTKVFRGGWRGRYPGKLDPRQRFSASPNMTDPTIGFRLCKDIDE